MARLACASLLAVASVLGVVFLLALSPADAGVVVRSAPTIQPGGGVAGIPPAGPTMPAPRRDVALVSVSGRVDTGLQQLGPEFVADLALRPSSLKLTALVANLGNEAATVYVDLVGPPYQLLRARAPEVASLAPGQKRSFECEYRLRGLYDTKMTAVPFAVSVITSEDFGDQTPANNTIECILALGRPDVVVTAVDIRPRILAGPPESERGYERMTAVVHAFITIENQGKGKLAAGAAELSWSAAWKKAFILWGEPEDHPIRFTHGRRLEGYNEPPVAIPALEPGASMTMWLQELSPRFAKPNEGRVIMDLTLTCAPRAGELSYDEADALNNHKVFDVAYCVPDVFGYHPIRGTDYDNKH